MRIAIVDRCGFATNWIDYCRRNGIPYKLVNPYGYNIIDQLEDCDAFMWHHSHGDYRDLLFAKQLLAAVEASGRVVFPSHKTGWHFDDKVGEMYLLQSLGLPLVPSYVFYNRKDALAWAAQTSYPKVFKLRGGAGSMNVILVGNERKAKKLINKAFGRGFKAFRPTDYFKERYKKWRSGKDTFTGVLKALARFVAKPVNSNLHGEQKGYAYFQEFMPGNAFDTRITVIAGKYALGFRRGVRRGDFRASGSGNIMYKDIDLDCVRIAFEAADKIGSQSLAIDFIYDSNHNPMIVETSYGFVPGLLNKSGGYWTRDLQWHEDENVNACDMMIEDVIAKIADYELLKTDVKQALTTP